MIAEHTGEEPPQSSVVLPVFEGSLFPISDLWTIEPGLDSPKRLRIHISQFAREICQDVAKADPITEISEGIGFQINLDSMPEHESLCAVMELLKALAQGTNSTSAAIDIGALLLGSTHPSVHTRRLGDSSTAKLFRLIILSRHLFDLESQERAGDSLTQVEPI
ncbi:hypothetical protein D3C73_665550 [compost metagenome]